MVLNSGCLGYIRGYLGRLGPRKARGLRVRVLGVRAS